jgi:hypothetical protein
MEGLLNVMIGNKKYYLNPTEQFANLKITILKQSGFVVDNFWYCDGVIADDVNTHLFLGKIINCEITDYHLYQNHGKNMQSFRCNTCRCHLNVKTFMCSHSDKCKALIRKSLSINSMSNNQSYELKGLKMDGFKSASSISKNGSVFADNSLKEFFDEPEIYGLTDKIILNEKYEDKNKTDVICILIILFSQIILDNLNQP